VSQLLQFQIEASQLSPRTKSLIPEMTLGRLSAYRANLFGLCQRVPARVNISKADGLGKALQNLARDAVKLSPSKSGLLDIAEFQASLGVISIVVGVVSSPTAEHARRSILHAIQKARKTLNALLAHLRDTRSHLNSRRNVFVWKGGNTPACKSDLGRNFDAAGAFSAFRPGQVGNVPKDPATFGDLFKALDDLRPGVLLPIGSGPGKVKIAVAKRKFT
jgi:hypothetical protein